MVDKVLVVQVVRFAFLIRLASLLLIFLTPSNIVRTPIGLAAIAFITLTSTLGLYWTKSITRNVVAHPVFLVIDVLVASMISAFIGPESPLVLYSLSTAVLIGILLVPRIAAPVMAILIFSYVLVSILQKSSIGMMAQLLVPITYATVGVLGSLMRSLHESAMAEQSRAHRLSEDAARERERARLARDMHDSVAKTIHGIGLAAAALPAWAEHKTEEVAEKARQLQAAAETASREAREILIELRADQNDRTLAEQLRSLALELGKDGIPTLLVLEGIGDCDHRLKSECVAIVGEALENVRRHSGATEATLTCIGTPNDISIDIDDNGRGFDPKDTPRGHFGLIGMRERAESIGASINVASKPDSGTTITVRAPRTTVNGGTT